MKKIICFIVSAIVGANAALVAMYFDMSDRVVLFVYVQVIVGLCLLLGVFDDDSDEQERGFTHTPHDAHDVHNAA